MKQALRCLLVSGVGYKTKHHYHATSVTEMLGGDSPDHGYARPIVSVYDLKSRFHLALLSKGGEEVQRWRKDKGITLEGASMLMSF